MSSNTQLAIPTDIPAYIKALAEKAGENNREALGGIKAGSFPRLSIGGSKFFIVEGGEKTLITDTERPDLPAMELPIAVVGFNPHVSKLYYEGEFEEGSDKEPTCSSDDGIAPDPHIVNPPSRSCATCPKNVWGSKITKQGKQVKACSDNKRLVAVIASDIKNEPALDLSIKPASLKNWAEYVRALDAKSIPVDAVVTKLQFDPSATFPKLLFKFGGFLTPEQMADAALRSKGDDVRLITSPRKSTSTGPVQQPAAPAAPTVAPAPPPAAPTAPEAPAAPAAPAPAPVPPAATVAAPTAYDPYDGLPPHVKLAVEGAGGLGTEVGRSVYKSLAGKDVPVDPALAAKQAVDPYEGQPPHVKLAVEGAGGLGTEVGRSVYKGLTGKDAPAAGAAAAAPAKSPQKTRTSRKTAETPPAAAPAATPPAATVPVPPAASFATPPAGASGGLGADLDALLKKAMATPTTVAPK